MRPGEELSRAKLQWPSRLQREDSEADLKLRGPGVSALALTGGGGSEGQAGVVPPGRREPGAALGVRCHPEGQDALRGALAVSGSFESWLSACSSASSVCSCLILTGVLSWEVRVVTPLGASCALVPSP